MYILNTWKNQEDNGLNQLRKKKKKVKDRNPEKAYIYLNERYKNCLKFTSWTTNKKVQNEAQS